MSRSKTYQAVQSVSFAQHLRDYAVLVKLRLSALVVFSAVAAYVVAAGDHFSLTAMCILAAGGFLVTGAANALNQVLEQDYDALMERTANRPLPAGRMRTTEAVLAAGFMCLSGVSLLALFNALAALLGMMAFVSYAFVYTPMKRHSTVAVLIGSFPGALPMAIGCVAYEGGITPLALTLFAIQFLWQFPHFWAIAFLGLKDYRAANFRFLPLEEGRLSTQTGLNAFLASLPLILVGWLLMTWGVVTLFGCLILSVCGLAYSWYSWRFWKGMDRNSARQLMFASFFYLPVVLGILLIETWWFI